MFNAKSPRIFWVALICTALCFVPIRKAQSATLAEYALLLFTVLLFMDDVHESNLPPGSQLLTGQLGSAAAGAQAANIAAYEPAAIGRAGAEARAPVDGSGGRPRNQKSRACSDAGPLNLRAVTFLSP